MNKPFRVIFYILLFLIAGCGFFRSPGRDRCDKLISRQKMTDVLYDVYLLEAYIQGVGFGSQVDLDDTVAKLYSSLFNAHNISRDIFHRAISCYLMHSHDMQRIHDDILNRMSILEGEIASRLSALPEISAERGPPWVIHDDRMLLEEVGNRSRWRNTITFDSSPASGRLSEEVFK